ncbi:MAG: DNA-binding protein WhiA, partial [Candidatus Nanopelagicaceae bacterium]
MAMTSSVKDELSRLSISKPCCRKAEVSSILRFAGGLHITSGKIMVEIE